MIYILRLKFSDSLTIRNLRSKQTNPERGPMEAVVISLAVAAVVAFVALIPKGGHFSEKQLRESQKDVQRLASVK